MIDKKEILEKPKGFSNKSDLTFAKTMVTSELLITKKIRIHWLLLILEVVWSAAFNYDLRAGIEKLILKNIPQIRRVELD